MMTKASPFFSFLPLLILLYLWPLSLFSHLVSIIFFIVPVVVYLTSSFFKFSKECCCRPVIICIHTTVSIFSYSVSTFRSCLMSWFQLSFYLWILRKNSFCLLSLTESKISLLDTAERHYVAESVVLIGFVFCQQIKQPFPNTWSFTSTLQCLDMMITFQMLIARCCLASLSPWASFYYQFFEGTNYSVTMENMQFQSIESDVRFILLQQLWREIKWLFQWEVGSILSHVTEAQFVQYWTEENVINVLREVVFNLMKSV
jgi:hypothetical protein